MRAACFGLRCQRLVHSKQKHERKGSHQYASIAKNICASCVFQFLPHHWIQEAHLQACNRWGRKLDPCQSLFTKNQEAGLNASTCFYTKAFDQTAKRLPSTKNGVPITLQILDIAAQLASGKASDFSKGSALQHENKFVQAREGIGLFQITVSAKQAWAQLKKRRGFANQMVTCIMERFPD
eukprot:1159505-Pelagomonas_calceolata.AAC.4